MNGFRIDFSYISVSGHVEKRQENDDRRQHGIVLVNSFDWKSQIKKKIYITFMEMQHRHCQLAPDIMQPEAYRD